LKRLLTTRELYEAAANRTPIFIFYDMEGAVYGPVVIDELTDYHVKVRIDSEINNFNREWCTFYSSEYIGGSD